MPERRTPAAAQDSGGAKPDVLPLAGIRVLEFCHTIMGPSAGLLLADLGAEVIKVESAPDGDTTRRLRGFASGFFYAFNRNKRSLAIDLKSDAGRALIHRLIGNTDIVLENYGPGTMDRLGCGYNDFAALNPRLVYCALKGFLSGPYEHRPALDEVVQFMAGLAYMTGPPGQPLRAGASVIDIAIVKSIRRLSQDGPLVCCNPVPEPAPNRAPCTLCYFAPLRTPRRGAIGAGQW